MITMQKLSDLIDDMVVLSTELFEVLEEAQTTLESLKVTEKDLE